MEEILKEIRDDVKTLLVSDGRKHERIKSLESTRKWVFGIIGTIVAAVVISAVI
jgi:hypothetical protein